MGDFYLMPQSKEDWFPYLGTNALTFKNGRDEIITLQLAEHQEEMMYQPIRKICSEGYFGTSEEYYNGEWLLSKYIGIVGKITYNVQVMLYVHKNNKESIPVKSNIYDLASYQSLVVNANDTEPGIGGFINVIADKRGNDIDENEIQGFLPADFVKEIEINGKTYQNVWYFDREGTPSLFVQQGLGIIAFLGFNGDYWVLQ